MTLALMILLKVSIIVTIVSVGAGTALADVAYLWRRPGLLLRSLAAMYVLVPAVALVLVWAWPMGPGVKAALLVLAVSAGAPLLPKKLKKLGSSQYVFSLLVVSSLVAIIMVPLWVALLSAYFNVTTELSEGKVALTIAKAILAPLALGMVLHVISPSWSERLSDHITSIAGLVLAVCGIALLAMHWPVVLAIGWHGMVALAALLICALVIGQFMGGPNPAERTALAVACSTRHVGIALVVAAEFATTKTIVLIIAYFMTVVAISLFYMKWRMRTAMTFSPLAAPAK